MYSTIQTVHSYWAYLVIVMLVLGTFNAFLGFLSNRNFKNKDLRISLFGLIVSHIQLLIGLLLYFISPWFTTLKDVGMGTVMKDATLRLYLVEHPIINIIAIVFITIGWSKHKKENTDKRKFGKIALFYGIGLVLLLSRIPWKAWFN